MIPGNHILRKERIVIVKNILWDEFEKKYGPFLLSAAKSSREIDDTLPMIYF